MLSNLLWAGSGFAVGWLVFERPELVRQWIQQLKDAINKKTNS